MCITAQQSLLLFTENNFGIIYWGRGEENSNLCTPEILPAEEEWR
jgi:hypothetical protein